MKINKDTLFTVAATLVLLSAFQFIVNNPWTLFIVVWVALGLYGVRVINKSWDSTRKKLKIKTTEPMFSRWAAAWGPFIFCACSESEDEQIKSDYVWVIKKFFNGKTVAVRNPFYIKTLE